jgi:hypothetical protein
MRVLLAGLLCLIPVSGSAAVIEQWYEFVPDQAAFRYLTESGAEAESDLRGGFRLTIDTDQNTAKIDQIAATLAAPQFWQVRSGVKSPYTPLDPASWPVYENLPLREALFNDLEGAAGTLTDEGYSFLVADQGIGVPVARTSLTLLPTADGLLFTAHSTSDWIDGPTATIFEARASAVPEASSLALALIGAAVWFGGRRLIR